MTAEVAVLNKLAVALAADSATTINIIGQNRPKIYTAQKLFPLVRNQPVGVMIYSNAEFVGIPWETIIKMYYQSTEGRAPLGTVEEYLYDLLGFLTKHPIRTDAREERHILEIAGRVLAEVQSDLNAIDDLAERTSALTEIIDKLIDENESLGIDESISEVDVDGVVEGHQDRQRFQTLRPNRRSKAVVAEVDRLGNSSPDYETHTVLWCRCCWVRRRRGTSFDGFHCGYGISRWKNQIHTRELILFE